MGYDDIDDDDPDDFRPTAEDGDMIDVMSGGKQTGFADVFRNLVGSQLLSVNLPPWRARDWTVTLGAMKVDGSQGANLVPGFPPDNRLKLAHHERIGMRPHHRTEQIIGVPDICYPVANRFVYRIF